MILSSLKNTLQMYHSTLDTFHFYSLACVKFTIQVLPHSRTGLALECSDMARYLNNKSRQCKTKSLPFPFRKNTEILIRSLQPTQFLILKSFQKQRMFKSLNENTAKYPKIYEI